MSRHSRQLSTAAVLVSAACSFATGVEHDNSLLCAITCKTIHVRTFEPNVAPCSSRSFRFRFTSHTSNQHASPPYPNPISVPQTPYYTPGTRNTPSPIPSTQPFLARMTRAASKLSPSPPRSAIIKSRHSTATNVKTNKAKLLLPNPSDMNSAFMSNDDSARSALATCRSHDKESEADVATRALSMFDLNFKYGPYLGISRMARWDRADKLHLAPPARVYELLQNEGDPREITSKKSGLL